MKISSISRVLLVIILQLLFLNLSYAAEKVEICSYILRDRVIVTDQILMKKALYVAFFTNMNIAESKNMKAKGQLLNNNKLLAETFAYLPDDKENNSVVSPFNKGGQRGILEWENSKSSSKKTGNLVFDLPYQIPSGVYKIKIDVVNEKGETVGSGSIDIKREDLKSYFSSKAETPAPDLEEVYYKAANEEIEPTKSEYSAGYIIFARSPFEYVYSNSRPKRQEVINSLSIRAVRNEFEPVAFSLYPLRDLGEVRVAATDLKGKKGILSKDKIKIGYIDSVDDAIGLPDGKFQKLPTLIRRGKQVNVKAGKSQGFYLTIRIDENVIPGEYVGEVVISPQKGKMISLPLKVDVEPITLTDIPNIDYFMLMTYEFTELAMPWGKEEKEEIYKSALNILKDYKEHGITTLNFHSPFVYITNEDGSPNLEDIFAGIRAAKETGFTRPIFLYMGHLIQTSKPRHPGSIIGFDDNVHIARLKYLVKSVSEYTKKIGGPEVIFLPIDEADDDYQNYQGKRQRVAPLLLKAIKEAGGKTMLTTRKYDQFGQPDYLASGKFNESELQSAHKNGANYYVYNNDVTTKCNNPAYARYMYGYYTWKNNINGMSSWTFQNTQNARGLPEKADVQGRDLYLAYPEPNGPISTLKWEAVREGIEDHKLLYQLQKRIQRLKETGKDASRYVGFSNKIKNQPKASPKCGFQDKQGGFPHSEFYQLRDNLISMILEADRRI